MSMIWKFNNVQLLALLLPPVPHSSLTIDLADLFKSNHRCPLPNRVPENKTVLDKQVIQCKSHQENRTRLNLSIGTTQMQQK